MFFGIPDRMILPIQDIKVVKVMEKYQENRFQLLVAKGIVKDETGTPKERNCISCYKYLNLEQLARIEKTYGKIEIFMQHETEFNLLEYL